MQLLLNVYSNELYKSIEDDRLNERILPQIDFFSVQLIKWSSENDEF